MTYLINGRPYNVRWNGQTCVYEPVDELEARFRHIVHLLVDELGTLPGSYQERLCSMLVPLLTRPQAPR